MSGETQADESGWTVDTLKAYVEAQFDLRDRAVEIRDRMLDERAGANQTAMDAALAAAKEAVATANTANEKRFDAVNEFRGQLADQAASLMPRTEADIRISTIDRTVSELKSRLDSGGGNDAGVAASTTRQDIAAARQLVIVSVLIAAVGVAVALAAILNK